ncbi:MAG: patatin-like phospholipase family protein [Rhizomicrobium sp.]
MLQGGGALGAYQAGVYEGLSREDFKPDWIAGTSIGAINAAIIAGNAPEERIAKLRTFWSTASAGLPALFDLAEPHARSLVNEAAAGWIAAMGVSGFFRPRMPPALFYPPGAPEALSFYDTAPLRETLTRLVDFDRINAQETRLSLGAVDMRSGKLEYFDNARDRIGPEHVMASGALPPAFPPVEIGGRHYWDGAVVSNTPLQHVLDHEHHEDLLIFQVDLFNAEGPMPRTIIEAAEREKDIRYASRTENHTKAAMQKQDAKLALRKLLDVLPPEVLAMPEARRVEALARDNAITVVQVIYRDKPYEGTSKDYEFSRQSMSEHWAAGHADICRTLARREHLICDRGKGATTLIDGEEDDHES